MVTSERTLKLELEQSSFFRRLRLTDWLWGALLLIGTLYSYSEYASLMDVFEKGILVSTAASLLVLGWAWRSLQPLTVTITLLSLFAMSRYSGDLSLAEQDFFLKFMFSSQSAIMWMSALYVMATIAYFGQLFSGINFMGRVARSMTWGATLMGFVGLMVRWGESYLVGQDVGHIPVSNLYEVFILFSIITALLYLHYERVYKTQALGGFVLLIISAAVAFLLWYAFERNAAEIQPLVPALQSYWMKIHVPANFVGYGAFALAAMVGTVYLTKNKAQQNNPGGLMATRLPDLLILDDVMYKSIALGFAFFTLATILGALWAAEAWGSYWSWDPKETWALIVWLNYAAWLHMRMTKGWRGNPMAWWSVIGLFVTLFAFVGVNMFLSGLHSYGEL